MEILGYILAGIIGVSLGLLGGGGSILAVPVLVYLFGIEPSLATAYSLFIVGLSSLFGAAGFIRNKQVSFKTALLFGLPSILMVYFTRSTIVPAIPEEITSIGTFTLTKDASIMIFFSLMMILAAFSMIRNKKTEGKQIENKLVAASIILIEGVVVGFATGIVGAGGGFLIVPALVILTGLPMKVAVGTSLVIIAAKSLIGFTGDLGHQTINWYFLAIFTGLTIVGIFIGLYLNKLIEANKLKKGFGYFVLIAGIIITIKELIK